jgi:hypothetical protein
MGGDDGRLQGGTAREQPIRSANGPVALVFRGFASWNNDASGLPALCRRNRPRRPGRTAKHCQSDANLLLVLLRGSSFAGVGSLGVGFT